VRSSRNDRHIEVHADQPDGPMLPIWNYSDTTSPITPTRRRQEIAHRTRSRNSRASLHSCPQSPNHRRWFSLVEMGIHQCLHRRRAGKPVYSWVILDRIFDTFHAAGIKPLVEIGFMPEALSTHPQPYRHNFPQGPVFTLGLSAKGLSEVGRTRLSFVSHLRARYGDAEVKRGSGKFE